MGQSFSMVNPPTDIQGSKRAKIRQQNIKLAIFSLLRNARFLSMKLKIPVLKFALQSQALLEWKLKWDSKLFVHKSYTKRAILLLTFCHRMLLGIDYSQCRFPVQTRACSVQIRLFISKPHSKERKNKETFIKIHLNKWDRQNPWHSEIHHRKLS